LVIIDLVLLDKELHFKIVLELQKKHIVEVMQTEEDVVVGVHTMPPFQKS